MPSLCFLGFFFEEFAHVFANFLVAARSPPPTAGRLSRLEGSTPKTVSPTGRVRCCSYGVFTSYCVISDLNFLADSCGNNSDNMREFSKALANLSEVWGASLVRTNPVPTCSVWYRSAGGKFPAVGDLGEVGRTVTCTSTRLRRAPRVLPVGSTRWL